MEPTPRLYAVVGPTGTGKSEFAQQLAERFDGVVLSADALQVYRELNIGTAKLTEEERRVPHFGLDLLSVSQPYSAALYQEYARGVIDEHLTQGQSVVVCGGTGLYVRAALDKFDFSAGEQEGNQLRAHYEALAAEQGDDALYRLLEERDPVSAALIHPHNVRRVIRALELCGQGESYAEGTAGFKSFQSYYPVVTWLGLRKEREALYHDLEARVDAMLKVGLIDEVRMLREKGLAESLTARQAIGYKELMSWLDDECSYEDAVAAIKQNTRRYAKRQMTFFNADPRIQWRDIEVTSNLESDGSETPARIEAA
ncbi:MAG: tRNA (adenosine(37)-N6)-dimethylallyltransferase MiaA [Coriobacteriia bacterium]|nr:tRNA (adenosine(37)-N6)-dimethylallyltransferase MiaA [Coriobacteriia bacterium]